MAKHKTLRNAYLNARFAASVKEFGLALIKTSNVGHTGSKGRARVEQHFSLPAMVAGYRSLYLRLLAQRTSSSKRS